MTVDFLAVSSAAAVARSPMERLARAAGARCEVVDGWSVAVDYGDMAAETATATAAAGWADVSQRHKLELRGSPELLERAAAAGDASLSTGTAVRGDGVLWCRLAADHALVLSADRAARDRLLGALPYGPGAARATDVTSMHAALTIAGPAAREAIARFCALDLRPSEAPVGAVRPGSVARQPGVVVREAAERYLILFGWAIGEYLWETVADAVTPLGGRPIGARALDELVARDA